MLGHNLLAQIRFQPKREMRMATAGVRHDRREGHEQATKNTLERACEVNENFSKLTGMLKAIPCQHSGLMEVEDGVVKKKKKSFG